MRNNRRMDSLPTRALALLAVLALAACASTRPDQRALDKALYDYSGAIRWGELDAAMLFLDPDASEPISALERERFNQVQVAGYYVRGREVLAKDRIRQVVELRLVNRHTQVERSVVDHQTWRWDAEDKRWWLTSGLPDLSRAR